jgi:hypothetical protein
LKECGLPNAILTEDDGPLRRAVAMGEVQRLLPIEATNAGHAEAGEVDRAEAPMCFVLFVDAVHALAS